MDSIYKLNILDHAKYPRNSQPIADPDLELTDNNASCGDKIKIQLKFDKAKKIDRVSFQCQGCVLAKASSSMLSELVKGKSKEDINKLNLKDLEKMMGENINTGRIKCAGLALKAMQDKL